ncbi:hypothetical protein BH23THE1_BH23THE1_04280 [soil metagenome]
MPIPKDIDISINEELYAEFTSFHPNITNNYEKYHNIDNFLSYDPIPAKFRSKDQSSLIRLFGWVYF